MAPQSSTTIGPFLRPDSSWMARATSSLPVPVSPWMTTETSIGAIFRMRPKICRIFTDWPTMPHSEPSRSGSTVSSSSMGVKVERRLAGANLAARREVGALDAAAVEPGAVGGVRGR